MVTDRQDYRNGEKSSSLDVIKYSQLLIDAFLCLGESRRIPASKQRFIFTPQPVALSDCSFPSFLRERSASERLCCDEFAMIIVAITVSPARITNSTPNLDVRILAVPAEYKHTLA